MNTGTISFSLSLKYEKRLLGGISTIILQIRHRPALVLQATVPISYRYCKKFPDADSKSKS
jgi:hypothetical protein